VPNQFGRYTLDIFLIVRSFLSSMAANPRKTLISGASKIRIRLNA
jgi:hypothetical protein